MLGECRRLHKKQPNFEPKNEVKNYIIAVGFMCVISVIVTLQALVWLLALPKGPSPAIDTENVSTEEAGAVDQTRQQSEASVNDGNNNQNPDSNGNGNDDRNNGSAVDLEGPTIQRPAEIVPAQSRVDIEAVQADEQTPLKKTYIKYPGTSRIHVIIACTLQLVLLSLMAVNSITAQTMICRSHINLAWTIPMFLIESALATWSAIAICLLWMVVRVGYTGDYKLSGSPSKEIGIFMLFFMTYLQIGKGLLDLIWAL